MPRKLNAGQDRKISVSISVDPHTWAELEKRCKEIQIWLRSNGVTEKDANAVSRSALVRSSIEQASKPAFWQMMKGSYALAFGINDEQQEIPFPKD